MRPADSTFGRVQFGRKTDDPTWRKNPCTCCNGTRGRFRVTGTARGLWQLCEGCGGTGVEPEWDGAA